MRTDGRTDMVKLIVAFRNAKAPDVDDDEVNNNNYYLLMYLVNNQTANYRETAQRKETNNKGQ
jgi:hypothetical protein